MSVYIRIVHSLDGCCCRFFCRELDEGIALITERSDFHDRAKPREHRFDQLFRQALDDASAIHRTIRRTGLIVNVVERYGSVAAVLVRGPGRRRFSGGPIRPDASAAQPLAVHRVNRVFGVRLFDERHERVPFGLERLRVAHDTAVGYLAEWSERLFQRVRLDLGAQVADEYMIMVARVELRLVAGRRRPVDFHLLVQEQPAVHRGQGRGRARVRVELEERVRVATGFADHFARVHRADVREQRAQQFFGDGRVEIADVQRTRIAFVTHS